MHKAHREKDAKALFDLRSRLHQLLRRTLAKITFTPEEDQQSPLHGTIEVAFAGTEEFRRAVWVYRGQVDAESAKVTADSRQARIGGMVQRGKRR